MDKQHKRLERKLKRFNRRKARGKYTNDTSLRRALNSIYRSKLKINATRAEILFKEYLESRGQNFQFQKGFLTPFHRIVDFYIPGDKIIIEIDGGYHKETAEKDARKDSVWKARGYRTIRILNEEIYDGTFVKKLYFF